jgi:ABC-type polysaccharide/polyol phosphate transport system ATPase subunit
VTDPAVVVDRVSKRFRMYRERSRSLKQTVMQGRRARYDDFWALRDVSFEIPSGSTFGLIGENGSGKSTLLKCIARILRPDTGSIEANGRLAALLELGSGFHPELSGRENVYLNGSILGLAKRQIDKRLEEIVDFAGIEAFIDQPVKNYSSGMYVRLGFSVAINVDPDILLVDEVLAVGDAAFQQKCMEKFADYKASGRTVVVVSHAMGQLRNFCDQVAWLEHGTLQAVGPAGVVVDDYVDETHAERDVTDHPTGGDDARWGSGEIRVERVEVRDSSGADTRTLRTGDQVVVRLHYRADRPVEHPVFGLGITTLEGHDVTGPNTRDTDEVPDRLEGEGHVDFRVDRLALLPGTYELTAAVYDYTCQHPFDHRHRLVRFDVVPGTPREGVGVVTLDGSWRYSEPDRQSPRGAPTVRHI